MNIETAAALPQHEAAGKTYPLEEKKENPAEKRTGEELQRFLLRISDEIETTDRGKRLNMIRRQIKVHKYADGDFFGYVDDNCEWQEARRADDEVWYSDNQMYQYLRTALMELSRTQTKVQINPAKETERTQIIAKFAQSRYDINRERLFTAMLKQTENTYALYNGITFRYTFFNFDKTSSRKEKIPRIEQNKSEDQENEMSALCAGCSRPVPNSAQLTTDNLTDQPCASCGSEFVSIIGGGLDELETVIGYDELPTGENAFVVPNPVGIVCAMNAASVEESSYLKWKQLILRSVLEDKFEGLRLPSTGTESVELRYISANKPMVGDGGGGGGGGGMGAESMPIGEFGNSNGNEMELLEFQQIWLDYPVYCKWTLDKECKLANGKTLPKGVPLGEMFPDGLYFAKVGNLIVDMWNEDKNRKWTSTPYSIRAGSMYGAGSMTVLSDQETINDLKKLEMANAWSNGVQREFVDPSRIEELSADPTVPTIVENMSDQPIRGYAYDIVAPSPLSQEIYELSEMSKRAIQGKIGAFSIQGGGAQDIQDLGKTATAVGIARDLATGRFTPDLELMADNLDRKQAVQLLQNEQEFFTPKQWEDAAGDYGAEAVKGFRSCDIKKDLMVTIVPGSFMPRSEAQVVGKLMQFLEVLPVVAQSQNPELLSYAYTMFGIPETINNTNSDRAYAERVIERFSVLADTFIEQYGDSPGSDITDPAINHVAEQISVYSQMPVDVFLDNHEAMIDAYRDWRGTDKGRDAPNLLLAAVAWRTIKHHEAIVKQAQMQQQMAMEATAPEREQAAEQQNQQLQMQAAQEAQSAEENDRQEDLMIAEKASEVNESAADRAHEAEMQADRQGHEKALAQIRN